MSIKFVSFLLAQFSWSSRYAHIRPNARFMCCCGRPTNLYGLSAREMMLIYRGRYSQILFSANSQLFVRIELKIWRAHYHVHGIAEALSPHARASARNASMYGPKHHSCLCIFIFLAWWDLCVVSRHPMFFMLCFVFSSLCRQARSSCWYFDMMRRWCWFQKRILLFVCNERRCLFNYDVFICELWCTHSSAREKEWEERNEYKYVYMHGKC